MVLEFIGFFAVVITASWIIYLFGKEVYNYCRWRIFTSNDPGDAIAAVGHIIIICLAGAAIYFAWIYAPFEIEFILKIK